MATQPSAASSKLPSTISSVQSEQLDTDRELLLDIRRRLSLLINTRDRQAVTTAMYHLLQSATLLQRVSATQQGK
ncbi:hypothetical protein [Leptolyngbya sp. FACHB-261]|uniref:hypothetical protein n=1 Tax=Leptolyngbya sp. FACHB-261 TaxID=2692806 RepID=UPI0016841D18|nr:hypothetical protein [Leptolyngbya sp. FACHB-261]MBD2101070.1 hypothetical protein [Leptolyngbya sp. FACHB-261]